MTCVQGHQLAGQVQHAHSAVRWATEYLIKCHISKRTFVGQVQAPCSWCRQPACTSLQTRERRLMTSGSCSPAHHWGLPHGGSSHRDNACAHRLTRERACTPPVREACATQVGNMELDHDFWGRPEDMDAAGVVRPVYVVNATHPGSDMAGMAAAGLASASLVGALLPLRIEASVRGFGHTLPGCMLDVAAALQMCCCSACYSSACCTGPLVQRKSTTPALQPAVLQMMGAVTASTACTACPGSCHSMLSPAAASVAAGTRSWQLLEAARCWQVLRGSSPKLAKAALKHAGQLLDFGARYQGSFTQSVPEIGAVSSSPRPLASVTPEHGCVPCCTALRETEGCAWDCAGRVTCSRCCPPGCCCCS